MTDLEDIGPAYRALTVYGGDLYAHPFEFVDETEDGPPHDYSGSTFLAQIRPPRSDEPLVEFAVDDTDAANGVIVISLEPADTAAIPSGTYRWDLQVDDETLLAGPVRVHRDVSE